MSNESGTADDPVVDDMELAYREALAALDAAESQVGDALQEAAADAAAADDSEAIPAVSIGEELARDLSEESSPAVITADSEQRISPREVIEAALFVGGDVALTARRLAGLIGSDGDPRVAVRIIDQLNSDYEAENRPYEIRLQEGGYRLRLRDDFARLQSQVYGTGPREVRLSPEVLEMLAFVAWNQPVDADSLKESGHSRPMAAIRQLLRLELVEITRTGSGRSDVVYGTGDRFLELFHLDSLDDLPQADIFSFK